MSWVFLVVGFWHMIEPSHPPPDAVYFPIIDAITLFIALMIIVLFSMNKQVKDSVNFTKEIT